VEKKVPLHEPKYCEAKHFTGPFFEMPLFWKEEVEQRAPLLNLDNNGFLKRNRGVLRARLEKWLACADFYISTPVRYVAMDDEDEQIARVIIKDADRTFFHPDHRKKFVAFLYAMHYEFGTYGQAMSYLAGLCLLVLTEQETAALLRKVNKNYIPGHWAAEAVGFATSAWVVEYFIQELYPDVAKHFEKINFWPDTFLQKILSGLCVHVLEFDLLFDFLDRFMAEGFPFLLKFCLSIVEHFRTDLLSFGSDKINNLYEIMRLDNRAVSSNDVRKILTRSKSFNLGDRAANLDLIRMQVYDKKVAPRLQRAPKEEAFEPCEVCEKAKPKWWHDDVGAACDACKDKSGVEGWSKY
jgi:hypothetical protein